MPTVYNFGRTPSSVSIRLENENCHTADKLALLATLAGVLRVGIQVVVDAEPDRYMTLDPGEILNEAGIFPSWKIEDGLGRKNTDPDLEALENARPFGFNLAVVSSEEGQDGRRQVDGFTNTMSIAEAMASAAIEGRPRIYRRVPHRGTWEPLH